MANERFTNPFPGLRPFESNEDHLFFGRDGQSDELLRRLRRSRFLAVLGTSGSGKSSLVRAGMLPSLFGGLMTQAGSSWRVALFRPGQDPIGNLAAALTAPNVFGTNIDEAALQQTITQATLRRSALGLVETTRQARMPANENLLVVVDQFEEIFRFRRTAKKGGSEDEAAAFIKLLLEAKRRTDVPIYIVITMRSDFLGDCAQFRDLPEAINDGQYLIPRMTRDQRREAITGPVAVGGGEMSGRLVNRLLNDVGDDPDHLPILQHALMRTWDLWMHDRLNGEPIDIRHYESVGTMSDALSRHADEAYDELPDDRSRALAEKVFKSLTEKGSDNREIRRPTRVSEIAAIAEVSPEAIIAVIEPFRRAGRSFLMPPATVGLNVDSLIDISHESLIRGWSRLRKWVDEEARSANIYRRIADTALLHREDRAGLWHDPDLALALRWREENRPNLVWAQHYHPDFELAMGFLEASKRSNEAEIAERERQRRREVRRTRIFATVLGIAFITSLGFLFLANAQRTRAQAQTQIAERQTKLAEVASRDAEAQKRIAETKAEEARREANRANLATDEARHQAEIAEAAKQSAQKQAQIAEQQRKEALAASERERQAQIVANQRRVEAERAAFRVRKNNLSDKSIIESLSNRLIALTSPQEAASWRLEKASALTQLGRHDESMQESSGMLKYFPDNLWASINRGYMNLIVDKPKPEEALKDFNHALELEPHSSLNHLNLAVTQAMTKDYDRAETSMRNAISWYRPMLDEGAFESAVSEDIKKATHRSVIVSDGPATITAYYYELANLEAFKGGSDFEASLREADEQATRAGAPSEGYLTALNWAWLQTRYEPKDYGALASQGHLWQRAGYQDWARYYFLTFQCKHLELKDARYDGLSRWVSRQLANLPKNSQVGCGMPPNSEPDPRAREFEAEELARSGKYNDAISLLSVGVKNDPNNIELLLKRAQFYEWSYDYPNSKRDFVTVLKLVEDNPGYKPFVYWYWGILGKTMGAIDDRQSKEYLRKAIDLGPAQSETLSVLSDLEAKDNPTEAIRLLQRSLTLGVSADTYFKLANLQNTAQQFREALGSIKMAIALASDNADYYETREKAEAGLGVTEIERRRHRAESYVEIGDIQLRQSKSLEAYDSYKSGFEILTALNKRQSDLAISADMTVVKTKMDRLFDLARAEWSHEETSCLILSVNGSDGDTREVVIDRGRDDGVEINSSGRVFSAPSESGGANRKYLSIGTAKVIQVEAKQSKVVVTLNNATGDGLVRNGDVVQIKTIVPPRPDRSALWRLAARHINLFSEDGKTVFNDYRKLYIDENTEVVDQIVANIVNDLHAAPPKVPNRNFLSAKIQKGRFQGMTVGEVLEKARPDDVGEMLEWVSKSAPFNGGDWKVSVFYVTWAQVGAAK